MICKDIGLLNRKKRRAVNAALRKRGLPPLAMTRQRIDAHLRKLTAYIVHINRSAMLTAMAKEDDLALVQYLVDLGSSSDDFIGLEPGEKVDHTGYFNLESANLVDQQREMIALMAQAPGQEDPLEHYMLSWDDGEKPTPQQVDEAVRIVLKVLGLERHQTIYASHKNTAHYHVHIAVNRVDRVTLKRTAAAGGFQKNGLHQAMAIIEYEQGWSENERALYRADELGVVHITSRVRVRHRDGPTGQHPHHEKPERVSDAFDAVTASLSEGARLHERRTNKWSFERIAKMVAAPIIRGARSFEDMHFALADEGIGYERGGSASGAVLTMQGRAIKATTAGREMSIEHLKHRYGVKTFTPRPDTLEVAEPRLRPIDQDRPTKQYERANAAHKASRAALKADLRDATDAALRAVQSQAVELYAAIDTHDWKGNGRNLNLARSIVARERSAATTAITSASHAGFKSILRAGSFPAMPQWRPSLDLSQLDRIEPVESAVLLSPVGMSPATPGVVPGYVCRQVRRECHYFDRHGRRAFRDTGSFIAVDRATDRAAVAAVLRLAAEKWVGSSVVIIGDRRFMLLCASLAVDMDIDIKNDFVRKEIARLRLVKARRVEADRQKAAAVAAASPLIVPEVTVATSPEPPVPLTNAKPDPIVVGGTNDGPGAPDEPRRRNRVWDPFADYARDVPSLEEWHAAQRAKAGPGVVGPLASAVLADPDVQKICLEMTAEGVPEAKRITQQAAAFDLRQAQQNTASGQAADPTKASPTRPPVPYDTIGPTDGQPDAVVDPCESQVLAMLGRVFHDDGWSVREYRDTPQDGPIAALPTRPQSINNIPTVARNASSAPQPAIKQVRRMPPRPPPVRSR